MNNTKEARKLQKGNSRAEQGGLEEMNPDGLPLIHYTTAAQLRLTESRPWSKLRDLDMQVQGSQKVA